MQVDMVWRINLLSNPFSSQIYSIVKSSRTNAFITRQFLMIEVAIDLFTFALKGFDCHLTGNFENPFSVNFI